MADDIKITREAFEHLVSLAWAGVADGAGQDHEVKGILRQAERMNPHYKAERKAERAQGVMERKERHDRAKAFAREHEHEEMWYAEGLRCRFLVRVLRAKGEYIKAKVMTRPERYDKNGDCWLPDSIYARSYILGSHVELPQENLKPKDAQLGEPRAPKKDSPYKPGAGLNRKGGSLL